MKQQFTIGLVCVLLGTSSLLAQEQKKSKRPQPKKQRDLTQLLDRFDKNKDGVLEAKELPPQFRRRFPQLDLNKDGKLTKAELQKAKRRGGGGGGRPGEVITPAARGERYDDKLKVGDVAPDFTLSDPTDKHQVTLSSFAGKKPVVLIFGSYT